MSSPTTPEDLLDLKMLPAWVNEPARPNDYANFEGEDERSSTAADNGRTAAAAIASDGRRGHASRADPQARDPGPADRVEQRSRGPRPGRRGPDRPESAPTRRPPERPAPIRRIAVTVRFLPHPPAFEQRRGADQVRAGRLFGLRAGPPVSREAGALRCAADAAEGRAAVSTG